jgi:hypothetical protein
MTAATAQLQTRRVATSPVSFNDETRSMEAQLATEAPTAVVDRERYELVDEVLRADGVTIPEHVVLLDDHSRTGTEPILGSVSNIRTEGDTVIGTLTFLNPDGTENRAAFDAVERAYTQWKQGHGRAVSPGYSVENYVDIPPGKTQTIDGRSYTAGARTLRVTTAWTIREVSLVAIGADPAALTRSVDDADRLRAEGVEMERERVANIRSVAAMAGDRIPETLLERALFGTGDDRPMTVSQFNRACGEAVEASASPALGRGDDRNAPPQSNPAKVEEVYFEHFRSQGKDELTARRAAKAAAGV